MATTDLVTPWPNDCGPNDVRVMEVGIGGIHLVQELMSGVDALIIVDAVDLGRPPGTVVTQIPDVADVSILSIGRRRDELADITMRHRSGR